MSLPYVIGDTPKIAAEHAADDILAAIAPEHLFADFGYLPGPGAAQATLGIL